MQFTKKFYLIIPIVVFAITLTAVYATGTVETFVAPWQLQDSSNNHVRMYVDSSGNVGIGTTTPSRPLTVAGSAGFAVNSTGNIVILSDNNGFARIANPGGGTNDGIFLGKTGDQNTPEIRLRGDLVDIPSGSFTVGPSALFVSPNQGGSLEIGGQANLPNPVTGGEPYIDFHYGTGSAQDYNTRIQNSGNNRLDIVTASGGPAFTVNGSNVGIGTSSPQQALDVNGNMRSTGNFTSAAVKEFKITAPAGVPICIGSGC